jgi:hypothetical protein
VMIGDSPSVVSSHCGLPCGRGLIPNGYCSPNQSFFDLRMCSNVCDVFQDVAVCYAGEAVVSIVALTPPGLRLTPTCSW